MRKVILLFLFSLGCTFFAQAQLLDFSPSFPTDQDNITLTFDATKGNAGLKDCNCDIYVHTGVITDQSTGSSDWKYVKHPWATTFADIKMTSLGNNKYQWTVSNPRTFYGVPSGEKILKISMVFRNADGSKAGRNTDASDIYLPIYDAGAFAVRFTSPAMQPTFTPVTETISKAVGDQLPVTVITSKPAAITLSLNSNSFATGSSVSTLSGNASITTSGLQEVKVSANDGTSTVESSFNFLVNSTVQVAALPAGVTDGVNIINNGTSAIFDLYAPGKNNVYVIGDFNNWQGGTSSFMKKTPDGNNWWVQIDGLDPNTEYAYQYLIDGTLKVADPYSHKVLDPDNDKYIDATTYPNLKAYPTGKTTGIVTTFTPQETPYNWKVTNFQRPKKIDLVVYELLVRDFVGTHNYQTLIDTLSYIKRLGVNAIELMPVTEFEGNDSWGYNVSFHMAADKYYGTENKLKEFIDTCHANGIAVILDMVLNHAFGQNPMVQMYWDAVNQQPAANSPWFNPVATHPYNVGYDFNHESAATKYYTKNVFKYWQTQFKVDGFRFDLSKGFTQKNSGADATPTNVANWGAYDASRIAIWKDYYAALTAQDPSFYVILEHFADNSEEKELSGDGMMLWGNMNYNYNEATMGYVSTSDISSGVYKNRGWTNPNLVTYMESHDEERLMYKNLNYGNSSGTYNIKNLPTALQREQLAAALFFTIPGPKMVWQFGERGYDLSINYPSGTANDRLTAKPPHWEYMSDADRKALYDTYSKLIQLRINQPVFETTDFTYNLTGAVKTISLNDAALKVVVVGNFDVQNQNATISFPNTGKWYGYLKNDSITVTGATYNFSLAPGEYHVLTSRNLNAPGTTTAVKEVAKDGTYFFNYPNPAVNQTTFSFNLKSPEKVSLKVYDIEGREVANLLNAQQTSGEHQISWDTRPSSILEGLYFAQLKIGNSQRTIKVLVYK